MAILLVRIRKLIKQKGYQIVVALMTMTFYVSKQKLSPVNASGYKIKTKDLK